MTLIDHTFSDQALRIKTDAAATGSTVTNITYSVSPQSTVQSVLHNLTSTKCRVTLLPVVNDSVSSLTRFEFFKIFILPAFYEIRRQSYPSTIGTPGNGVALSVGCFYLTQTALFKCLHLPIHRPSTLCRLKPQLQSTVVLREWPLIVASALAQVWSQVSQSRRTF